MHSKKVVMSWVFNTNRRVLLLMTISLFAGLGATALMFWAASSQGLNPTALTGDAKGYMLLADNIRTQHMFSAATSSPFYPESFRTPVYPFFLALLFSLTGGWTTVLILQVLLMSIAPVLLYLLVRPYHERAAFWGSVIFALEPLRLFYSASLLSDALFMVMFLCTLLLLERSRNSLGYSALTGIFLGTSILMRPIAMFLPFLFVGYLLWFASSLRKGLVLLIVLCVAVLVTVAPWSLRNHALFGSYNISSVGAVNLMLYNAPEFLKFNSSPHGVAVYQDFMAKQETLSREDGLSLARSSEFTRAFREVIRSQEFSYAIFHVFKTAPFFLTDGLRDTVRLFNVDIGTMPNITTDLLNGRVGNVLSYFFGGGIAIWLLLTGAVFWGVATLLWLWLTLGALRRKENTIWVFFAAIVLYFAFLTGPVSNARYRLPVEGFLIVSAAAILLKKHEA